LSATLSNCGEALKLLYTKLGEKSFSGQGNYLGMVKATKDENIFLYKNLKMFEIGYPQPSPKVFFYLKIPWMQFRD